MPLFPKKKWFSQLNKLLFSRHPETVKHILEKMLERTNAALAVSRWQEDQFSPSILAYADTSNIPPNITTCWRDIRPLIDPNNNQVC